jgi:hypothetical protein
MRFKNQDVNPQIQSGRPTSASVRIPDSSRTSREIRKVPSPEVRSFIDHFVGAFLLGKTSRLCEQKASAVLVIV